MPATSPTDLKRYGALCRAHADARLAGMSREPVMSERQIAADLIIDTINRYAPNFRRSIVGIPALSPCDLEQCFGLPGHNCVAIMLRDPRG